MSGFQYYNQSIPKYVNGEPFQHIEAKQRVREILEKRGYDVETDPEHVITVPVHKDIDYVRFPVDVYAVNQTLPDTDKIVVQIDGEYHRASWIQKGRTQNRDDTLREYCERNCIRYVVFNHPNIVTDIIDRKHGFTDHEILRRLGLEAFF